MSEPTHHSSAASTPGRENTIAEMPVQGSSPITFYKRTLPSPPAVAFSSNQGTSPIPHVHAIRAFESRFWLADGFQVNFATETFALEVLFA